MSGKFILLLFILVAGVACQQFKVVKGSPVISLVEDTKNDCSEH